MGQGRILGLVYSYYNSPNAFLRHVVEWNKYPYKIRQQLSIFIVDDCSMDAPLSNVVCGVKQVELRTFRIREKVKWNGYACRNIGAGVSENKWLLITDIDLVVPTDTMEQLIPMLLDGKFDESKVYLFRRVNSKNMLEIKRHGFTFLMTRKLFWDIGGYDEEFAGLYYGGCSRYYARLDERGLRPFPIIDMPLLHIGEEIFDTPSNTFERNFDMDSAIAKRIEDKKSIEGRCGTYKTLTFPYDELTWK